MYTIPMVPDAAASAYGLMPEHRELVRRLLETWRAHYGRNVMCDTYYRMHNKLVDLGISIPPQLTNLNAACGWGAKTVNVMADHSRFDGYVADDEVYQTMLDDIVERNNLTSRWRKACVSALKQCFVSFVVTADERGHARVSAYPATLSTGIYDDVTDELSAGMFVVSLRREGSMVTSDPNWVDVVTPEWLIRLKEVRRGQWAAEYVPNGLKHINMFVAAYGADYDRPFGTGRITREVRGYIDSAVRENINEEVASAFAASAQKYLLGTDSDPFGGRSRWDAYIGTIFNIDVGESGVVPQFGQLPQPSMQPLTDHFRNLCSKMSAATGIHASQFGMVHDNPASSEAIYAENEPLVLACTVWNTDAGIALRRVAVAAIATEMGTTYEDALDADLGIDTHFMNPAMPTLAQMADSSIKLAGAVEGFSDTDTFWEMNGFDAAQRKRVRRELRQVRGQNVLDQIVREAVGDEGEPGGDTALRQDAG